MAAITYTAAQVVQVSGPALVGLTAGATIAQGDPVYKDTSDNNEYKVASKATRAAAKVAYIAAGSGVDGHGFFGIPPGSVINFGAASTGITEGERYFLGASGAIIPSGDLASTDRVVYLGLGLDTADYIEFQPHYPSEDAVIP